MDRFDPFAKYADVYGDIINWEKDPMNKPRNQNKYFFSDGKTYYEQICKMLRLMSVFKEAFNQIYSNEDEISEAWENFVNNLSASVVEGSEPDVTLTWADDSVNFEFTMVPGVPGEQGVGITSISFNSDYTMTITLSDGNTYTSMSLKGETGPQGPQGETGSGLQILDVYATLADLQSAHPTGQPGDAYQVGSEGNYTLYIWSSSQSAWVQAGTLGTVSPYTSAPLMDGTASAGSQNLYARGDHVHPSDTSRASKEELDALIKTSQALIDQSFTYRESPAIQDGLARIDKIKGNTLVWNQLVQNGNFADTSKWTKGSGASSFAISNNEAVITIGGTWNNDIRQNQGASFISGHKYFASFEAKATTPLTVALATFNATPEINFATLTNLQTTFKKIVSIVTAQSNASDFRIVLDGSGSSYVGETFTVRNVQIIDLTAMGVDSLTVEEFTSLFPLSYYEYNAGSLLPFNGTGLKITGKNQLKLSANNLVSSQKIGIEYSDTGAVFTATGTYSRAGYTCKTVIGQQYTVSFKGFSDANFGVVYISNDLDWNTRYRRIYLGRSEAEYSLTFTATDELFFIGFYLTSTGTTGSMTIKDIQLELGSNVTEFEPYTTQTTSLPISTYFPTGMKSAGTAYDELAPKKAVTRIGAVDLGSLEWGTNNTDTQDIKRMQATALRNVISKPSSASAIANVVCTNYTAVSANDTYLKTAGLAIDSAGNLLIYDPSYNTSASTEAFKQAMSGIYLYYELETPTETSISPELDLSFRAYLNGTEQLLPVNGSVPSTSPIIADMTYLSIDDAMEYIIEKLANVPQNTQQILESLEDDVADLQTDVGALQPAVSALQTSVGNINTNIGQLSSTVAGHTASISGMQSDISDLNTGLNDLEDTVTDNTSRIGTLETGLTNTDSEVDAIDARVLNLETDLLKVVQKEYDYESVAGNTNFGVQTGLQQEPGYKIVGIVGSEVQQGEYTSAEPWIIVTQAHIHYTSTGGVILSMMARNVSEYTKTNVRVYLYVLCIKDTQSE